MCYFDYMNFESAKAKTKDICTKIFCGGMILFYVLWIMFHDESGTPYPVKFEIALLMIVVSGNDHCVVEVCLIGESLHRLGFALIGWFKA